MVAESWGIELIFNSKITFAEQIAEFISQSPLIKEVCSSLPEKSRGALLIIAKNNGKYPWDQFTRKFGEFREMGAAKRERERPDRKPASISENLFYKALIGRAFFETGQGLQEFAFIPEEYLHYFTPVVKQEKREIINLRSANKIEKKILTNDYCVDHATTILAGLRIGLSGDDLSAFIPNISSHFLIKLLQDAELVSENFEINSDKVKQFLEAERGQALGFLAEVWKASHITNELELIENLVFENGEKKDPIFPREALLELINLLPEDHWHNIQEFCVWIHLNQPDILRSGGEYDAWFIKDKASGQYINGFENWQRVEGEYIRAMIMKSLFWLGFVDLGKNPGDSNPSVFRKSKWFDDLYSNTKLKYPSIIKKDFEVDKSGRIVVDRYFARNIRYQIARCCEWDNPRSHNYIYHFSQRAFVILEKQGLKITQLITLLKHYARKPVPRNILQALERRDRFGEEVQLMKIFVIKVKTAAILDRLLDSTMKKYILSRLDATTAEISADSLPIIRAALIEMGVFAEILPDV